MRTIDLNADLGEGYGPWRMGDDAAMLDIVTSANVACGGHAGDPETMFATLQRAARNGVVIGAHPSFADREGFGRRLIPMPPAEIGRMVAAQIGALQAIARLSGARVRYVKPHGALANLAARDDDVATAIAHAIASLDADLAVLAISGTRLQDAAEAAGLDVYREVFADRGYQPNGQLVPRGQPGALIHDPAEAADRLLSFLDSGLMPTAGGEVITLEVDSICVHGDSPEAVAMAQRIRQRLSDAGAPPKAFLPTP